MDTSIILLLLLVPLLGALTNIFFGKKLGSTSGVIATFAVLIPFVITLIAFFQVNESKVAIQKDLFEWIAVANLKSLLASYLTNYHYFGYYL